MKKLTIIIFVFISFFSNAQNYFLRHYSVEDGILSSEIYSQVQDSTGYLWFATSRGVSRFDGQTFVNYTVKEGLPSNSIITMFLDAYGNIWFAGYDASLSYYHDNQIIPYKYIEKVKKISNNFFINNLYVDKNFNLYIAPNFGGFYKIDSLGNVFNLDSIYPKDYNYLIVFIDQHPFFIKRKKQNKKSKTFNFKVKDSLILLNISTSALRRHIVKIDDIYFFSLGKTLYLIDKYSYRIFKEFSQEISGLYIDKEKNLWVSVLYNGVFIYNPPYNNNPKHLLEQKSPIHVIQDNEHGYWIPTTESGIYYLLSLDFVNYDNLGLSKHNIISIEGQKDNLYFSTFNQQLFKCEVNKKEIIKINPIHLRQNKNFTINDILITQNGIWFLGSYLYRLTTKGEKKLITKISRGYSLAKAFDNKILATASYGFISIVNDTIYEYFKNKQIPASNSIYQSYDSTIWLGSINGLFSLKNSKLFFWGKKYPVLKTRINHISQFQNYILLATSGAGFIMLNIKDSSITNITEKQGLATNFITKILVLNNTIWLGTNKGVARIKILHNNPLNYKIDNFTRYDGLFTEEIKDITFVDKTIFLATSRGLVSFYPNIQKKIPQVKLVIDSIIIDNKKIKNYKTITLQPNEKNLTIYFKGISFRTGKNILYRYKLQGLDNKWYQTKNRYITFSKLPAGNYKLYITATAEKNHWNPQPIIFTITKKQHFSETSYFFILLFIIITSLISAITYLFVKHKKKQIQRQRQLIFIEQKALRAQMNPHFIFNALNSIRRYILEKDIDNADNYLTKFATLMRRILDNSKLNFITLDNEIKTLELYLQLEKLRFDDSFSFNIKIDSRINLNKWLIPPMLLQPFVENAIWHGLAPKQREGKLNISIVKKNNSFIQCIIDDNGIGRKKAQEIAKKRKNHSSTGLTNIKERITLLNKLYGKNISMKIIDKYNPDNTPAGTTIIINFPNFINT